MINQSTYPLMLTDEVSDVDECITPSEDNVSLKDVFPDKESLFGVSNDTQVFLSR
jgi:hypothetical protein